jgi:ribonuclease VapC
VIRLWYGLRAIASSCAGDRPLRMSFGALWRMWRAALPKNFCLSVEGKLRVKPETDTGAVLDASAVLAYLQKESGIEAVRAALKAGAFVSSVNLAEVCAKLRGRGLEPKGIVDRLKALGLTVVPFTEDDAMISGDIFPKTQPLGLSLGDRACLALCMRMGSSALTAEKTWARLKLGFDIRLIR